jgi:HD-GYP domain-containing protein (c-di-GMP phosphodiesterase class II)
VADAYDVMTSYRSYRDPMPQENVREELERGVGTQFDPRMAKIMLQMMAEDTEYRLKEEKAQSDE